MTPTPPKKTALVTGASRGIGRAIAEGLADTGVRVLVHYSRGEAEAREVVAGIIHAGGLAETVSADLAHPNGPARLAEQVRDQVNGVLDILVSNAGVSKAAKIEDLTVDDFDRLYAVNVRAPYFLVQQLLPLMPTGSNIVFVSSLAARAAMNGLSAYGATKGAIDTMVKHFASELGERGIRVIAIAPGVVDTDMSNFTKTDAGRGTAIGLQSLKRLALPADIAGAAVFLASEEARWITGDTVRVDGGSKL